MTHDTMLAHSLIGSMSSVPTGYDRLYQVWAAVSLVQASFDKPDEVVVHCTHSQQGRDGRLLDVHLVQAVCQQHHLAALAHLHNEPSRSEAAVLA